MRAIPLQNFSSLHETSLGEQLGWKIPCKHFNMQFSLNLHTPLTIHPKAFVILQTQDEDSPPIEDCCFSISNLKRWRLDISSYRTINDYLRAALRWHRCNYANSKKKFESYGCEISLIETDWPEHVEQVYHLYENVAKRYEHALYDLSFFQAIAKRPDYKLLCTWFEGQMIGVFVLQEELSTLHCVCSGLDYQHSSPSYAYSWMNYALFEQAIAAQKYQTVDVGFNSDEAKKIIGFQPIPSRIDIYAPGKVTRGILKAASRFFSASLTEDAKLKLKWR